MGLLSSLLASSPASVQATQKWAIPCNPQKPLKKYMEVAEDIQAQNVNSSAPEVSSVLPIIIMRNYCLSFQKKLRDPVEFFFVLS